MLFHVTYKFIIFFPIIAYNVTVIAHLFNYFYSFLLLLFIFAFAVPKITQHF